MCQRQTERQKGDASAFKLHLQKPRVLYRRLRTARAWIMAACSDAQRRASRTGHLSSSSTDAPRSCQRLAPRRASCGITSCSPWLQARRLERGASFSLTGSTQGKRWGNDTQRQRFVARRLRQCLRTAPRVCRMWLAGRAQRRGRSERAGRHLVFVLAGVSSIALRAVALACARVPAEWRPRGTVAPDSRVHPPAVCAGLTPRYAAAHL